MSNGSIGAGVYDRANVTRERVGSDRRTADEERVGGTPASVLAAETVAHDPLD
jgi:hypothetical protein